MTKQTPCVVVNVHDPAGYDLYGGSPSWLGNPFIIGRDGDRETVIGKYIQLRCDDSDFKRRIRFECAGKRIACYCKPQICHLDWVAAVANGEVE